MYGCLINKVPASLIGDTEIKEEQASPPSSSRDTTRTRERPSLSIVLQRKDTLAGAKYWRDCTMFTASLQHIFSTEEISRATRKRGTKEKRWKSASEKTRKESSALVMQ